MNNILFRLKFFVKRPVPLSQRSVIFLSKSDTISSLSWLKFSLSNPNFPDLLQQFPIVIFFLPGVYKIIRSSSLEKTFFKKMHAFFLCMKFTPSAYRYYEIFHFVIQLFFHFFSVPLFDTSM